MQAYEKLGLFYLGRQRGDGAGDDDLLLLDSRDLTTHALCVGMTGSGKTGLGVGLIEEAAIDGIPVIAIDPKGDLANLLLTFPELAAEQLAPWVDPAEAARKSLSVSALAAAEAQTWREGLAAWGQGPERIARLRQAADLHVLTPGSASVRPVSVLRSFAAPPAAVRDDPDTLRMRVLSAVDALLGLLGIDADPVRSPEHILLSNLLDRAWRAGQDLDLPALIGQIQQPPFDKLGVIDLETFFPRQDRFGLAIALNNLLASPAFAAWAEGDPLDVADLFYAPSGRPRVSIVSIAHLPESERMFFVTLLLTEVLSWCRAQAGTGSLRALLYMDEIAGFFPPVKEPPSKAPMLTLLKQARAFGLGVVLATQNPMDLDYKGLSNAGTWFIGRLQADRDKARVMEGLAGAAAASGRTFDAGHTSDLISGLQKRHFLLHSVHEEQPVLFETRWCLSYLRGPMTLQQLAQVAPSEDDGAGEGGEASAEPQGLAPATPAASAAPGQPTTPATTITPAPGSPVLTAPAPLPSAAVPIAPAPAPRTAPESSAPPVLPPEVTQDYLVEGDDPQLRARIYAVAQVHYAKASDDVDEWVTYHLVADLPEGREGPAWEQGELSRDEPGGVAGHAPAGARYEPPPAAALRAETWKRWSKDLATHLYREVPMTLLECKALKLTSRPDEPRRDFMARLAQAGRERRDEAVDDLRDRYQSKIARLQDRIRRAEARVEVEREQYRNARNQTAISVGSAVLGAIFGRRAVSSGTVGRATTSVRSASRAAQQHSDIERAEENVRALQDDLAALEQELADRLTEVQIELDPGACEVEEVLIRPRKSDIAVERLGVLWSDV